jgi:outer membrane protein assembly factor BamB
VAVVPPRLRPLARRAVAALLPLALAGCITDSTKNQPLSLPTPLWSVTSGQVAARIFVDAGGTLLYGTSDSIIAVSGATGSRLWSKPYGALSFGLGNADLGAGKALFIGSQIQVVDVATGNISYTDPLSSVTAPPGYDGTNLYLARSTPPKIDQVSYAGAAGWSTSLASACPNGCTFAGTAVSGDTVYLAGSQIAPANATAILVMAFSRTTGAELWRKVDATRDSTIAFQPVVAGKQLILVTTQGRIVLAMDRVTRATTWSVDEITSPIFQRPVVAGTTVLLPSPFLAEGFAADSGTIRWSVQSFQPLVKVTACPGSALLAATNGLVVLNSVTGTLVNGRESITLGSLAGDVGATTSRYYVGTVDGPKLAAYPCT